MHFDGYRDRNEKNPAPAANKYPTLLLLLKLMLEQL